MDELQKLIEKWNKQLLLYDDTMEKMKQLKWYNLMESLMLSKQQLRECLREVELLLKKTRKQQP